MSNGRKCQGVIVPMVTPFTVEGDIDPESVGRIIDHLIAGGMRRYFCPWNDRGGGFDIVD